MILLKDFNFKYLESPTMTLSNINLDIKKGECILLTGASGCGKTTILKLLNGLAPQYYPGGYSGELKVAHLKIGDSLTEFSKVVGSVFQNPKNQFFHLNSTDELAFSMENYGYNPAEIKARIQEVSKKFNAEHLLNRDILELSGGERQKLAFMASMMLDADVYILDEITSNLDLCAIKLMAETIKLLKSQGKTIVIAEHRIYYLRELVDKLYIIKDGQILHCFNQEDLKYFDGTHCRTRQLDLEKVEIPEKEQREQKENYLILEDFQYKVYNDNVVHKNETFKTGNIYAIIGENGCGKTTFANAIAGFSKTSGNLILDDEKIKKNKRINYSFQVLQDVNYQLFTNKVETEIKLGSGDTEKFDSIVDKLKLRNLLHRHPNTLSGGEKQRVAIASALLSGKKILIFDEPTSGLDYINMLELSKLIIEISKKDIIIFVITHDYEFLCNVADEVLHFDNKGIAERIEVNSKNKEKILQLMN